ncbi:hypothetical protein CLV88_12325 [Shimia abyssi]|uniref:Uncharacterized protein n=1 Tax=Shimia abyssi TaxID=1662395 RepID=A0A2P8F2W4_9RHOB|nr:hypothetical protein CLV88_12325 [Shimia abyssi]
MMRVGFVCAAIVVAVTSPAFADSVSYGDQNGGVRCTTVGTNVTCNGYGSLSGVRSSVTTNHTGNTYSTTSRVSGAGVHATTNTCHYNTVTGKTYCN